MTVQYSKTISIGKERYEWLESHPEHSLPVAVRAVIDDWMRKAKEQA